MPLGNALSGVYSKLENGFFGIMDWLELRGIPVYNVIEPLENKGIPAFPLTIAIIALILIGLWGFLFFAPKSVFITVNFVDESRNSINQVQLQVLSPEQTQLFNQLVVDSGVKIKLDRVEGQLLSFNASKAGFEPASEEKIVTGKEVSFTLELERKIESITARIKLVDGETQDSVTDASVSARFDSAEVYGLKNNAGEFELSGIPKGKPVSVSVSASGYEEKTKELTFYDGESVPVIALTPSASAGTKMVNLTIRVLDEESRELVKNALIKVFNKDSGEKISERIDPNGEFVEEIPNGTSIRWTASREGYLAFDSSTEGLEKTLQKDEELIEVFLKKGGTSIIVSVVDSSFNPLSDAVVSLYNSQGELIDENTTGFGGFVSFEGLKTDENYFVGAFKQGLLPKVTGFSPLQSKELTVSLETPTSANSANIGVFTADEFDNPVAGASLEFYSQDKSGRLFPLGIPTQETDGSGFYTAVVPVGISVFAKAFKEDLAGDGNVFIEPLILNQLEIILKKPSSLRTLSFLDEQGLPICKGSVRVTGKPGSVLFDGNISEETCSVVFDALGNKSVNVSLETPDGKSLKETVNVERQEEKQVLFGAEKELGLSPAISFLKVTTIAGEEVQAVTLGQDYFLVFETQWSEGIPKGGIHVRVGTDNIENADSQDFGILGFEAENSGFFYGRTYNAIPIPGNETIDFQNSGEAGSFNKWLEVYFEKPQGQKTVKVRVKARHTARQGIMEVHYRAWSEVEGAYYRNPIDEKLGEVYVVEERTGLYAETSVQEVQVLEGSKGVCSEKLCAGFVFVDEQGNRLEVKDFKAAVVGERYALEAVFTSNKILTFNLKAVNGSAKAIGFTGFEVGEAEGFLERQATQDSIESELTLGAGETAKARIYFTGVLEDNALIHLTASEGEEELLNEKFSFEVFSFKEMQVSFTPEHASLGEDFEIKLQDEEGNPVENARIVFKDSEGKTLKTVVGNASPGKGKKGIYNIKNAFRPGMLEVEITALHKKPVTTSYTIASQGVLQLPERIEIIIPADSKEGRKEVTARNLSNQVIENITFEQKGNAAFNEEFSISIEGLSVLGKQEAGKFYVNASYNGMQERKHAEAELIATGSLENGLITSAKTLLVLDFNPELNPECLAFRESVLEATLFTEFGFSSELPYYSQGYASLPSTYESDYKSFASNYSPEYNSRLSSYYQPNTIGGFGSSSYSPYYSGGGSSKQVPLTVKNNCEIDLLLSPEVESQRTSDKDIEVNAPEISIAKGEEKQVSIEVFNKVDRRGFDRKTFNFKLSFKSPSIEKSIPLIVNVLNKRFALTAPEIVHLYLTQVAPNINAETVQALPTRNIGNAVIENLTFNPVGGFLEGIQLRVQPSAFPVLLPNQTIVPRIIATGNIEKSKEARELIIIRGVLDGRPLDLRQVQVFIHASAPSCLKIGQKELYFESSEAALGSLSETVNLTNNCLEPVRITDISPRQFGNNFLTLTPIDAPAGILGVGQKARFQVVLTKRQEINTSQSVRIYGFMTTTGKQAATEPLTTIIKLGAVAAEEGLVSNEVEIPYCDNPSEKAKARFPKISEEGDCSTGYCDAVQLASFLAGKINETVNEVENKIHERNNDASGLSCSGMAFCNFSELGVRTESFTVYFSNDNLSPELLKEVIAKNSGLSGIQASTTDYSGYNGPLASFYQGLSGTFIARQLLLPQFKGCGKYRVEVGGAVQAALNNIEPGSEMIIVNLIEKKETEECKSKIQNFLNFLPADSGLTYNNRKSSWLGTTDSVAELETVGKSTARELFGNEERFQKASVSNVLHLSKKVGIPGIVEVKMPAFASATQPVKIEALINEEALALDKDKTAREASTAILGLKRGAPAEGTCISRNEDSLTLKSAIELVGAFSISDCTMHDAKNELRLLVEKEACCTISIEGTSAGQKLTVKIKEHKTIDGLEKESLKIKGTSTTLGKADSVELVKVEEKTNGRAKTVFKREVEVCGTGNNKIANALNEEITVIAENKTGTSKSFERKEKNITLKACAVHPVDLVAELIKETDKLKSTGKDKEKKVEKENAKSGESISANDEKFYALVSWKNPPEEITFLQLAELMEKEHSEIMKEYFFKIDGESIGKTAKGLNAVKGAQGQALVHYGVACAVSDALGHLVLAFFTGGITLAGGLVNVGFDCGIPVGVGAFSLYGLEAPEQFGKAIDKYWGPVKDSIIDGLYGMGLISRNSADATISEELVGTGVASTTVKRGYELVSKPISAILGNVKEWLKTVPEATTLSFSAGTVSPEAAQSALKQANDSGLEFLQESVKAERLEKSIQNMKQAVSGLSGAERVKMEGEILNYETNLAEISLKKEQAFSRMNQTVSTTVSQLDEDIKKAQETLDTKKLPKNQSKELTKIIEAKKGQRAALKQVAKNLSETTKEITTTELVIEMGKDGKPVTKSIKRKEIVDKTYLDIKKDVSEGLRKIGQQADEVAKLSKSVSLTERPGMFKSFLRSVGSTLGKLKGATRFLGSFGIGIASNLIAYKFYKQALEKAEVEGFINLKCNAESTAECKLLKNETYETTINIGEKEISWNVNLIGSTELSKISQDAKWIEECSGKFAKEGINVSEIKKEEALKEKGEKLSWEKLAGLSEVQKKIVEKARELEVPESLALAVADAESNSNPNIKDNLNPNGSRDIGIMQVNSKYFQDFCDYSEQEIRSDVAKNIDCGLKELKVHYNNYGQKSEGVEFCGKTYYGWNAALRAYNGIPKNPDCKAAYAEYVELVRLREEKYLA